MRTTYDVLPTLKEGIPTKEQIAEAKKIFQREKRKGRFDSSHIDYVTLDFAIDHNGELWCYYTAPNEGKLWKHSFKETPDFSVQADFLQPYFVTIQYRSKSGTCLEYSKKVEAINGIVAIEMIKNQVSKRNHFSSFDSCNATLQNKPAQ